jgi:hypothetical protein
MRQAITATAWTPMSTAPLPISAPTSSSPAGAWEPGRRHHTTAGTPQGGVRRPWLANLALAGLAKRLGKGSRVARDADALLVMAKSLPAIAQACPVGIACLDARGLALPPEKTRMVQRTDGVDFLGCPVQRRGQKRLSTPQQQKGQVLRQEVRSWLQTPQTVAAEVVTRPLNPLLRGGAMSYRQVVSTQTCQTVEDHRGRAPGRWAQRRPPKQSQRWLYRRDGDLGKDGATGYANSRERRGQTLRLRRKRMPALPRVPPREGNRQREPGRSRPASGLGQQAQQEGSSTRANGRPRYGSAETQRWQCRGCGQALCDGQEVHLQHRIPVYAGGSDDRANRPWLHAACHRQRHRQGVTAGQSA